MMISSFGVSLCGSDGVCVSVVCAGGFCLQRNKGRNCELMSCPICGQITKYYNL